MIEEILLLAFELCLEVLFNLVLWFPSDVFLWWRKGKEPTQRAADAWTVALGAIVFGATLGAVSLLFLPQALIGRQSARAVNLLATPIACALLARTLARRRSKEGQAPIVRLHFWFALTFSFAFLTIRFIWTQSP